MQVSRGTWLGAAALFASILFGSGPAAAGDVATSLSLSASNASPVFSEAVQLTATVTPASADGAVQFFVDGVGYRDPVAVVNGQAMIGTTSLGLGSHQITASFGGAAPYASADAAAILVAVGQSASSVSLAPGWIETAYGAAQDFTATVTALSPGTATPAGTVSFFDNGAFAGAVEIVNGAATLRLTLGAGAHNVTAHYQGSDAFGAADSTVAGWVVDLAAPAMALVASPAAPVVGQPVTLTATLLAGGAGTTPGGVVSFTLGNALLGTAAVDANGVATLSTVLPLGPNALAAAYGGDANYSAASAAATATVQRAPTTIVLSASANHLHVNQPITLQAVVSALPAIPAGTVQFADGAQALATASLDATGAASVVIRSFGAGVHHLRAEYLGATDLQGSSTVLEETIDRSAPVAGSGTAVRFDGVDQAAVAQDDALDAARTVELWFQRAGADAAGAPACLVRYGTRFGLCLTAARDGIEVRRGDEVTRVNATLDGGWHHLALVEGEGETSLWLDGAAIASLSGGFGPGSHQTLTLAGSFAGALDEVRLWSTARTANDLAAARMQPVDGHAEGLVALWRMDEGAGAALYDAAPAHVVASLVGTTPPAWVPSAAWRVRTTAEEHAADPFVPGYDPDGAQFTVQISQPAAHGAAAVGSPGSSQAAAALQTQLVAYTPAAGFAGTDLFTITIASGSLSSSYTTEMHVAQVAGAGCASGACGALVAPAPASGGCSSGGAPTLLPLAVLALFGLLRPPRRALRAVSVES